MLEFIGNCVIDCATRIKTTITKFTEHRTIVKQKSKETKERLRNQLIETAKKHKAQLSDKLYREAKLRLEAHKAIEIEKAKIRSSVPIEAAYYDREELKSILARVDRSRIEFYNHGTVIGYKGKRYNAIKILNEVKNDKIRW